VKVDTQADERESLVKRSDEFRVDRTMLSADQVSRVMANLTNMRTSGLYREALAYHDLGNIRLTIAWDHESKPGAEQVATLGPGAPNRSPTSRNIPATDLQWDTPIPPPEAYGVLAKMSAQKEATVYKSGRATLARTSGRWI
jgi:hypothetical protein